MSWCFSPLQSMKYRGGRSTQTQLSSQSLFTYLKKYSITSTIVVHGFNNMNVQVSDRFVPHVSHKSNVHDLLSLAYVRIQKEKQFKNFISQNFTWKMKLETNSVVVPQNCTVQE